MASIRPNFKKFRGAQRNFVDVYYTEFHLIRSRNSVRMGSNSFPPLSKFCLSMGQFLLNAFLPDNRLYRTPTPNFKKNRQIVQLLLPVRNRRREGRMDWVSTQSVPFLLHIKSLKTKKKICLIYNGAIYKNSKTDRYVELIFPFPCLRFLQISFHRSSQSLKMSY